MASEPANLLRNARIRAALSQRALARRARTTQSVVARIELSESSPSWDTLVHLLRAAGFELVAALQVKPVARTHMLEDVARILALSPEARLAEVRNLSAFQSAARRV